MAIYHLSAKLISRKSGRSATAAAAYRAAERIDDRRTGEIHDYTQKRGVEHAEIVIPTGVDWTPGRAELWNAVEAKNKRQDAQVAREFVVALPDELTAEARQRLAVQFAREIADTYRVAADLAIHAPGREGDHRNHHAHILTSTNTLNPDGTFGNKARALDAVAHDRNKGDREAPNEIEKLRGRWADLANQALERAGRAERIDHRSLEAQGIDRAPTQHMGPSVSGMVRRGADSDVARRMGEEANARLFAARETGRIERELAEADRSILDLSGDLAGAIRAREERQRDAEHARAERKSPAVQSSRFAVAKQTQSEARAKQPKELVALGLERKNYEAMPIEQQAKEFENMAYRLCQVREKRFRRATQKATDRQSRLRRAMMKTWESKPQQPTGLLARFKQEAYAAALDRWKHAYQLTERLHGQAENTRNKIAYETLYDNWVMNWARDALAKAVPELATRVSLHKAEAEAKREKERQAEQQTRPRRRGPRR